MYSSYTVTHSQLWLSRPFLMTSPIGQLVHQLGLLQEGFEPPSHWPSHYWWWLILRFTSLVAKWYILNKEYVPSRMRFSLLIVQFNSSRLPTFFFTFELNFICRDSLRIDSIHWGDVNRSNWRRGSFLEVAVRLPVQSTSSFSVITILSLPAAIFLVQAFS